MKKLQRLTGAVVLAGLLGLSAFAGHASAEPCVPSVPGQIETPCIPPPTTSESVEPETTGSGAPANDGSDLTMSEIALSLLETALSLF